MHVSVQTVLGTYLINFIPSLVHIWDCFSTTVCCFMFWNKRN